MRWRMQVLLRQHGRNQMQKQSIQNREEEEKPKKQEFPRIGYVPFGPAISASVSVWATLISKRECKAKASLLFLPVSLWSFKSLFLGSFGSLRLWFRWDYVPGDSELDSGYSFFYEDEEFSKQDGNTFGARRGGGRGKSAYTWTTPSYDDQQQEQKFEATSTVPCPVCTFLISINFSLLGAKQFQSVYYTVIYWVNWNNNLYVLF